MPRQTLLLSFQPQATPPEGDPPAFDVKSGPGTVTHLGGDDQGVPTEASYETHVTMTGETTFVEDGMITIDGGGLRLSTVGAGVIEPSPEEGTMRRIGDLERHRHRPLGRRDRTVDLQSRVPTPAGKRARTPGVAAVPALITPTTTPRCRRAVLISAAELDRVWSSRSRSLLVSCSDSRPPAGGHDLERGVSAAPIDP